MRILVVDDDRLVLNAIHRVLRHDRPDWDVFTASNGLEALTLLGVIRVDLIVTDLLMPTLDGMGLLASIRRDPALANLPLIFITAKDDRETMRLGMCSGADDFLPKPFASQELISAVEARIQRLDLAPGQDAKVQRRREQLEKLLTTRELGILNLVAAGRVTKEIAADLGLSPRTISVHRANIMRKLDIHNAAALAALAIQAGISGKPAAEGAAAGRRS